MKNIVIDLLGCSYGVNRSEQENHIRESYLRYGKRLVNRLNGSFAFVLYDNDSKEVFCARDPLGVATLYYIRTEKGYRFASDMDELFPLFSFTKTPNLRSMKTMMQCFAVDLHETMYENIYRLPPGHSMTIRNDEKKIERYWFPEKIKIDYKISEKDAAKKLRGLLKRAVEKNISTLEETAFELSGGLDSSSIVSILAQKRDPGKIDSYSMDFGSLKCDEGEYVDTVLKEYQVNHQKIPVGSLDYRKKYSLDTLYTLSPHWPISLTFAMLLPMLEKMKEDGKKVVVSGQGGDHLFTGTPYVLYDLFLRGKLAAFHTELKSYHKPWSVFKAYVLIPLLGEKNVGRLRKIIGKKEKSKSFWDDCVMADMTEKEDVSNPAFKHALDAVTTAYHATVMDGNIFHSAKRYYDIEYRHPFFDRELVEFAMSLPSEMKYANRTIKRILRKAMEGILPEKINQRKGKAEFSPVLFQQIDAIDLDALLGDANIVRLGLIDWEDIEECLLGYKEGKLRYVSRLWGVINVEYWYRYNGFEKQKTK